MHALAPSIVARAAGEVVGYELAMPLECAPEVPILEPMFAQFEVISYLGAPLLSHLIYVMGQVCVARSHRGTGVFDALYAGHRRHYAGRFDLLVTEVAVRNARSLRAHDRVGFVTVAHYMGGGEEWAVVALPLSGRAGG